MSCDIQDDKKIGAMARLSIDNKVSRKPRSKSETRGQMTSGLTHECRVFGCIAAGDWPSQIDVAQVICLGLVALQHRGQESAGIVSSEGVCATSGGGQYNEFLNTEGPISQNFTTANVKLTISAYSRNHYFQQFVKTNKVLSNIRLF